jgi:hypothetical protein
MTPLLSVAGKPATKHYASLWLSVRTRTFVCICICCYQYVVCAVCTAVASTGMICREVVAASGDFCIGICRLHTVQADLAP